VPGAPPDIAALSVEAPSTDLAQRVGAQARARLAYMRAAAVVAQAAA
jgi:hypothetical protein